MVSFAQHRLYFGPSSDGIGTMMPEKGQRLAYRTVFESCSS